MARTERGIENIADVLKSGGVAQFAHMSDNGTVKHFSVVTDYNPGIINNINIADSWGSGDYFFDDSIINYQAGKQTSFWTIIRGKK